MEIRVTIGQRVCVFYRATVENPGLVIGCLYLIAFFIAQKQDRLTLNRKLRQLFTCMSIIPIDLKVKQKKQCQASAVSV